MLAACWLPTTNKTVAAVVDSRVEYYYRRLGAVDYIDWYVLWCGMHYI